MDIREIGILLEYRRQDMGIELEDLSKVLGIDTNILTNIENGAYNYDIVLLLQICDYLKISVELIPDENVDVYYNNLEI